MKTKAPVKERTGEEMFKYLVGVGKERAKEDDISFVLTKDDVALIVADHARENAEHLTPTTTGHYEKLLQGAIVYVNRTVVTEKASVQDALSTLNAFRSNMSEKLSKR